MDKAEEQAPVKERTPVNLQTFTSIPRPTFSPKEFLKYEDGKQQKLKILDLIERFYNQIRYGCTAPTCNTPSCRTHRSQITKGVPYRLPTPVSARAFAAYLASLDNPYSHLCENTPAPKSNPFDLAFPTSRILYSVLESDDNDLNAPLARFNKSCTECLSEKADWFAKAEFEEWMNNQLSSGTPIDLGQPFPYTPDNSIDTKSLTQRIFNSLAWKSLPFSEDKAIFTELGNVDETTRVKSILMGLGTGVPRLEIPYNVKDFLDPATNEYKKFMTLEKKAIAPEPFVDRDIFAKTWSDPSKLMVCGLNPFPKPELLESSGLPADDNTTSFGLRFFHSRLSQPHYVLCQEFIAIGNGPYPDIHIVLASSVKSTYFDSNPKCNIPSSIAAHIVAVAIAALTATVFANGAHRELWDLFEAFRRQGHVLSDSMTGPGHHVIHNRAKLLSSWALSYEESEAQYLMKVVLRSFASWSYMSEKFPAQAGQDSDIPSEVQEMATDFKKRLLIFLSGAPSIALSTRLLNQGLLEWVRTIFLRNWDGEARFNWNTDVGASIEFMRWMYMNRDQLHLEHWRFTIDILIDRMDYVEASKDWIGFVSSPMVGHILDFPWLFTGNAKVTMFRSINLCRMFAAYETSITTSTLVTRMTSYIKPPVRQLLDRLSTSMDTFIVLDIRRDNILGDSFNQLWRRQKRELFRPLKIRMGMEEGEEGVDMGGVQQEFFRLAIAEALDPGYGLFTIDERTRMTWFRPMSTAPLYQYTLIGLLFGLAVYNGITLAITFPLAFYRKLLNIKNTSLKDIEDGWPELHTGLKSLLTWSEGKVEDIFLRTYTFSFESLGVVQDIDMKETKREEAWPAKHSQSNNEPSEPSEPSDASEPSTLSTMRSNSAEPEMVTNENRKDYVDDYIFWLTDKSIAPQFQAFAAGFYLPLQKQSLRLFTPEDFQSLLEGHQSIDIDGLKKTARYEDGFRINHPRIKDFWEIVQDFSPDQHRNLLEFVTASPRVPVRGMDEVTFIIQRNGVGDERLPTSMTCFGRLLLPEYSSKKIMAEKLRLAIENSIGFGTQ